MNASSFDQPDWLRAYRPLFFESLSCITGIADDRILVGDRNRGLLTEIDLRTGCETFPKRYDVDDYAGVPSFDYYEGQLYSVYGDRVYVANYASDREILRTKRLFTVENCSELTGIAVTQNTIYLATDRQSILAYDRDTEEIDKIGRTPGVGADDLHYDDGQLYILDRQEQTLYVMDLDSGEIRYEVLTPFENPVGITHVKTSAADRKLLYVAYSRPTFEIFDTGDSEFKLQIQTEVGTGRDKEPLTDNFVYPLVTHIDDRQERICSSPFLVEMTYVEKLHALPEVADEYGVVKDLEWKISLPVNSDRQELISVERIGDFEMHTEELPDEDNRKVAVFSIPEIDLHTERRVFGWKARVKVSSIRYCPKDVQPRRLTAGEREQFAEYLRNEDGLDMDSDYVQDVARDAVRSLSGEDRHNAIKQAEAIRDYIYERVVYVMDQYHDGTEAVLRSGEGSCGEYLSVFLSLLRLNGIPARKCGNYKVPAYKMQAGARSTYLSPDFNHVWLQFYIPDWGWVPLESSADDGAASFRGWPKRYFMALAWYHLECRLGGYFEEVFKQGSDRPFKLSAGELGKNDIKFTVIGPLESL